MTVTALGGPASVVDTACPLDCPDACSLAVTVQHGTRRRHRRVAQESGHRRLHLREGAQVRRARLRTGPPALSRRSAPGAKARASSSASRGTKRSSSSPIDSAARRRSTAAHRSCRISYGGSNGLLTQDNLDAQLWRRFGTSRLARTVCAAPTGAANQALYGKMPSVTYQDYPEAALIVLWGVNPSASGIHLVPYVREAQKRGAKLVVVDPRTTPLARVGGPSSRRSSRAPTSPSRWPSIVICSRTATPTRRSCASTRPAPTPARARGRRGRSSGPPTWRESTASRSSASPSCTRRARRRSSAAAGASSAIATAATPRWRCWRCRRSAESSASAAAATR